MFVGIRLSLALFAFGIFLGCPNSFGLGNEVEDQIPQFSLEEKMFFIDASEAMDLDQIRSLSRDKWNKVGEKTLNLGLGAGVVWLQTRIHKRHHSDSKWFLEYAYSSIDYLDIYIVENNSVIYKKQTGDLRDFNSRPVDYRNFLFPIFIQEGDESKIYMRVKTEGSTVFPLEVVSSEKLAEKISHETFGFGLYY